MKDFTTFIKEIFEKTSTRVPAEDNEKVSQWRGEGLRDFLKKGLPGKKEENWRHHPVGQLLEKEYHLQLQPDPYQPVENFFKCKVENIGTNMFTTLNGWYVHDHSPLTIFPNGIIIGSLAAAIRQFPDLVLPRLMKNDSHRKDSLVSLNQAFFNDGLFLYIPDNSKVEQPVQLVNLVNSPDNLFLTSRNLIIVGKNSSVSFIQCNDSLHFGKTFIDNVTEIFLEEQSALNYCKMDNKDPDSILIDHIITHQKGHSRFSSNMITFNAGYVRNDLSVNLNQPFADTRLYGLYLVDKEQYVDNQVHVNHAVRDCTSYQLYKGITDNKAISNFNGHILVEKDAQHTVAFQTNNNITMTDEAQVMTKPFLEIYADDVQCSHGATVGQLNEDALFYLRTRGICERNARMLLMYAFANEVIANVEIEGLRHRLTDMVKMRLSGELHLCDQCILHCTDSKNFTFEIDISKI